MSAKAGRRFKISWDGAAVAGVRAKNLTIENEPIDGRDEDDSGIRMFVLTDDDELEASSRAINGRWSGVTKDETILKAAAEGTGIIKEMVWTTPLGSTITGMFALTSIEVTGEMDDAFLFSCDVQSHGEWVWADPTP